MDRTRVVLFASVIAAAMVFGGVIGATVLAQSSLSPARLVFAATSPSPSPHSNESAAHEQAEAPEQEAAENNGTAHHRGPVGHPCGGHANEDPAHEQAETAAQEAAENAPCPSPAASPAATK